MILWQRKNRIIDALVDRIDELEVQVNNRTVERDAAIRMVWPNYDPGSDRIAVDDRGELTLLF